MDYSTLSFSLSLILPLLLVMQQECRSNNDSSRGGNANKICSSVYLTYIFHQRLSPQVATMTDLECELRWGEVIACQLEAGGLIMLQAPPLWTSLPCQIRRLFYWPSWLANKLSKDQPQEKKCGKQWFSDCVNARHHSCWQTQRVRRISEHVKAPSCHTSPKLH